MSTFRISFALLCCFLAILIVELYLYSDDVYGRKSYILLGQEVLLGLGVLLSGEEEHNGMNGTSRCAYPSMTTSWNTGMVTRYTPYLSPRCESLWVGEDREVHRIESLLGSWLNSVSDELFLEELHNCTYVEDILSDNFYTSPVETAFPVAFLLTIHDYPQQVVRLLRVMYRPHNVYCIHVDAKAKQELIEAFRSLSTCIPNILMPKKLVNVFPVLGESILESQLSCLEVLHSVHDTWKWRYVMNLCGTELPLATNRQIIEHLERLKGSTYIYASDFPHSMRNSRFGRKFKQKSNTSKPYKSMERFGEPPYGMQLYKSNTYVILSYAFTDFVLTHPKAIAFRNYIKGGRNAEEQFYISLYYLPEAPIGDPPSNAHLSLIACIWMYSDDSQAKCNATVRHDVCIAGVGTMKYIDHTMKHTSEFFFNKYSSETDHVIMDCMEERIVAKNKLEYVMDCT